MALRPTPAPFNFLSCLEFIHYPLWVYKLEPIRDGAERLRLLAFDCHCRCRRSAINNPERNFDSMV